MPTYLRKEFIIFLILFIIGGIFWGITGFLCPILLIIINFIFIKIKLIIKKNQIFKLIKNNFENVKKIHSKKYKLFFSNNKKLLETYSLAFEKSSTSFLSIEKDLDIFNKKQAQLLSKMLNKVKEMKKHEYIADYSL